MEQFGKGLVLEPFYASIILGARAVVLGGTEALRAEVLPGVIDGSRQLAFAYANLAPPNYEESMATWEYSTRYARDKTDLEGVYLSMAQISIDTERFDAAREQIALSSLPTFRGQRVFLLQLIERAEAESRQKGGG